MEEALREVLRLLVWIALPPQVAVNRPPVLIEQQADQGAIPVLVARSGRFDHGPMRRQERPARSAHVRVTVVSHGQPTADDLP